MSILEDVESPFYYHELGLKKIREQKSAGCLVAFPDKTINESGVEIEKEDFINLLEDQGFFIEEEIPSKFLLKISYSPIHQFNKWIFYIINKKNLVISEIGKPFNKSFFFMEKEDTFQLVSILYNIIYEKFLYDLYQLEEIEKTSKTFEICLDTQELVIYKDYFTYESISVKVTKEKIPFKRKRKVKITYLKKGNEIEYIISCGQGNIQYSLDVDKIKLKKSKKDWDEKDLNEKEKSPIQSAEEVESQLIQVKKSLEEVSGKIMNTNKFANITLGRINGKHILVNLPTKRYANIEVKLEFLKDKLEVFHGDKLIKTCYITDKSKSTWLVSKKK